MAEPERSSSFAKSVEGLHKEDSALDRARALRDQFARALNDNQKQKENQTERPPAEGSQMVKTDAPVLKPSPSGPLRDAPDRQASAQKLAKEHDAQGTKLEAARKAQETLRARQGKSPDHDRDHDHDHER